MQVYGGNGGLAPPFLSSALDGREWSASSHGRFTARGKGPWNPLAKNLSEPQSWFGVCDEEKNLALPGIEPETFQPFATLTVLSRLMKQTPQEHKS
jgi:hypothetical protein